MKNSQKGFVAPLLIAIIALLVIGGGIYIYNLKSNQETASQAINTVPISNNSTGDQMQPISSVTPPSTQTNQTTFKHPTGLYSFTYPSDWQFPAANVFSKITSTYYPLFVNLQKMSAGGKNNNKFSVELTPDQTLASNFEKAGHMSGSSNFTKQNITLGNLTGYRMEYQDNIFGQKVDEVRYVIPVSYGGVSAVVFIGIDAWDSTWLGIAEPVAKTLKIDLTKVPAAVQQMNSAGGKY